MPPTYSIQQIAEAIERELEAFGESLGRSSITMWKSRGYFPIDDGGQGWTRFGSRDAARLLIMAELSRRHGVSIELAHHLARARGIEWPEPGDSRRYLVMSGGEIMLLTGRELASGFGRDLHGARRVSSMIVVDALDATERIAARLAEVAEEGQ